MIGWTAEALYHEAVIVTRRAYFPRPDTRVVERPGWLQIITPSLKQGAGNEVVHSVLSADDVDAAIERTREEYAKDDLRFRWQVTPETRPHDMASRLESLGFVGAPTYAMVRSISGDEDPPASVRVKEVDEHDVHLFTRVLAEGFGMDPEPLLPFHRAVLAAPERRRFMFIAFLEDELAGAANLVLFDRSALLQGAVVVPALRGRGVYHAMVSHRLRFARARGIELATVHASVATSAPILLRAGFERICELTKFFNR